MNEKIDKIQQDIENSSDIKPHIIDVSFVKSYSGKVMNLLNSDDATTEILDHRYYHFKFEKPIYIHQIEFMPVEGVDLLGLEIISTNFKGKESTIKFSKKEQVIASPEEVIKEFKIKPRKKPLKKAELKKIELLGFLVEDLNSIKQKVEEIDGYKTDLQEELNTLIRKNAEYNDKEDRLDELNKEIPSLESKYEKYQDVIDRLRNKRKKLNENNQTLKNSTSQLEAESENLNKEIPEQKTELKKLIADKSIFSTEMAGYIKQADKHIRTYFVLSVIPWLLIVCISHLVFNKAADLSTIYNSLDGEVEIFAIFWTRLPFALITISILFVAYEISKVFVQNMMKIQSQKRVFAKIGIVAKDVADSSILGLEQLTDEEKFELRTKLKMDLLKSHLSHDIGEGYEYNIKTSLFKRFADLFKK